MTKKDQDLSTTLSKSISNSINKKGVIGLAILLFAGTVGSYSFYSKTNEAIKAGQKDREVIKSSINSMSLLIHENQIGRLENRHAVKSVQESLDRVIELQLLILEKLD